jgi:hypothetical protein
MNSHWILMGLLFQWQSFLRHHHLQCQVPLACDMLITWLTLVAMA